MKHSIEMGSGPMLTGSPPWHASHRLKRALGKISLQCAMNWWEVSIPTNSSLTPHSTSLHPPYEQPSSTTRAADAHTRAELAERLSLGGDDDEQGGGRGRSITHAPSRATQPPAQRLVGASAVIGDEVLPRRFHFEKRERHELTSAPTSSTGLARSSTGYTKMKAKSSTATVRTSAVSAPSHFSELPVVMTNPRCSALIRHQCVA